MALKLTFAVNVPVRGQRYDHKTGSWVPHIHRRDLHINLCEICGSQIVDRRRANTCSNRCTEVYWERVREAERNNSSRPYFWPTFRWEAMERDGHRCTQCGSKNDLEVHHITPIYAGGTNAEDNLVTLCHACHVRIHAGKRRVTWRHEIHNGKTIEEWCKNGS